MREIKFRAWHTNKKIMYLPNELGQDDMTISANGQGFLNVSGVHPKFTQSMPWMIPMQFTGLKDKSGKEIYEGDIVNCRVAKFEDNPDIRIMKQVVKFDRGTFRIGGYCAWFCYQYEVIGNIYENPELLKETR